MKVKAQLNFSWIVPEVTTNQGVIRVVQVNTGYADFHNDSGEFNVSNTSGITNDIVRPKKFSLNPAYPNPFNGATIISFDLHKSSYVRLTVFDVRGREIETLIDGRVSSGTHALAWAPHGLSSGIYVFRITDGERYQVRRVLYMLGPRHLGDVNQTLNTLLEFDKRTVIGNRDHPTVDFFANRVLLADILPRVRRELDEAPLPRLRVPQHRRALLRPVSRSPGCGVRPHVRMGRGVSGTDGHQKLPVSGAHREPPG